MYCPTNKVKGQDDRVVAVLLAATLLFLWDKTGGAKNMSHNSLERYQMLEKQMQQLLEDPQMPVLGYGVCIIEGGKISFE